MKGKFLLMLVVSLLTLFAAFGNVFGHCDTMDGPLVKDSLLALEKNNVNYILKWVSAQNEPEVTQVFNQVMKVRKLGPDAKDLADSYLFHTVVRIHRNGEGVSFTGVKPYGTPIDEKIMAADKSIELGKLTPLEKYANKEQMHELKELFGKVMKLKKFDVNDVKAGREYIEAYVHFFKFAEGEEEHHE